MWKSPIILPTDYCFDFTAPLSPQQDMTKLSKQNNPYLSPQEPQTMESDLNADVAGGVGSVRDFMVKGKYAVEQDSDISFTS